MESFANNLTEMQRTPLSAQHVAALRKVSFEDVLEAGHVITEPGQPADRFVYILDGAIEVFDPLTGEAYLPVHLGPGQFAGEIAFLSGTASALALRTRERTHVLIASREDVLALMSKIPEMSDIIISVFAARRRRQIEAGDGNLTLISANETRELRHVESFLSRNKVPYQTVGKDDPRAETICKGAPRPGVAFGDAGLLEDPSPSRIATLLGLDQGASNSSEFDVLIVGGGPSGVAAAVYSGAEGMSSVLVEEIAVGGQAGTSSRIENYMGFPTGISGGDLVWRGEVQAMKFGTQFVLPRRVEALAKQSDGRFEATLNDGAKIIAKSVIVATGVQYRRLPWDRLEDFEGNGVYYAATETEARYTRDDPVVIVGGGNSAGQAAMFLSRTAAHVHVFVRSGSLAASMSDYLSGRLHAHPAITLHFNTQIKGLDGESRLERVRYETEGHAKEVSAGGVFVMVGAAPKTDWLPDAIALDERGFVLTGEEVGGSSQFETSLAGIFAVGDVRADSVKRVAAAVGEGSVSISAVWSHVQD